MASKVTVTALFCDQGMGTLVQIFEGKGIAAKLTNLALFDLGSTSKEKRGGRKAVDSVIAALNDMVFDGVDPAIDLLSISHGDSDHFNLLPDLQKDIMKSDDLKGTKIGKMVYGGGDAWSASGKETRDNFAKHFGILATPLEENECHYTLPPPKPPKKNYLAKISGVEFRLLLSTVGIVDKVTKSVLSNGGSAVVVMHFGGKTAIIPGDATADTLGWINTNVFAKWDPKNPIDPCAVLGAPHHGARRTIADDYVPKKRRLGENIGEKFSGYVSANNVVASAGYMSQHHHPYKSVMKELGFKVVTREKHDWVWCLDDNNEFDAELQQTDGIYTTITSLDDPPDIAEPEFTITAKGEVSFTYVWHKAEDIPPYERADRYAATPHER